MLKVDSNELCSNRYKAFINYAFSSCSSMSFVVDRENQTQSELLEKIKEHCLFDILEEGFIFEHPETGTHFECGYMVTLKCNALVKSLFVGANDISSFDGEYFPEELCFYRDGCIWFKYISHEGIALMRNENEDDVTFLKSCHMSYYHTV